MTGKDLAALVAPETRKPGRPNGLGFDRVPADTRVVVAMSGGVDSSVTAALLAARGYRVIGITLQLYDHGAALARKGACCAGRDIHDARKVADRLGIAHYVLDYESRFSSAVIEDFADSYARGETPVPCIRCNQTVKFRDLLATARELGADCLATGHYVRRLDGPDGPRLARAVDDSKDQSWFLFATTPEQLAFLRFPLGGLRKETVRALAAQFDLPVADKPDSQDICFVPQGRYADLVARLRPEASEPGEIVHLDGRVLGRHDGIVGFTVGQRRGLGIGGEAEPLHVVALEPESRRVIVGPRLALAAGGVDLRELNWPGGRPPEAERDLRVRLRNTHDPVPARLAPGARDDAASILFERPEYGVSAGQAAVLYDGDILVGGGWIERALPVGEEADGVQIPLRTL